MIRWLSVRGQGANRYDRFEVAGAFGDLGISVPVLLALSASGALDLSRALLLFGAYYIWAGLYFRIPLPVQPLKAATALVIAQGLGAAALKACSLWIAAIFIVLSITALTADATWPYIFFTKTDAL